MKLNLVIKLILLVLLQVYCSSKKNNSDNLSLLLLLNKEEEKKISFYTKIKTISQDKVKSTVQNIANLVSEYKQVETMFNSNAKFDVDVYFVEYNTPNYDGEDVVASGIMAIPKTSNAVKLPIFSYQHGTTTKIANAISEISKSNDIANLQTTDSLVILRLLLESVSTFGFVVCIPDYIGFGSSKDKFHPYVIKKTSKTTSLNLIKVTKELLEEKSIKTNGKLFLTGYSQGGYVTLATQIGFKENPIQGLKIAAAAPAGGVYSLSGLIDRYNSDDSYDNPVFFAYPLYVYSKVYKNSDKYGAIITTDYVKSDFVDKIQLFADRNKSIADINQQLRVNQLGDLITDKFLNDKNNFSMYKYLKDNNLDTSADLTTVDYPLHFYHSSGDNTAPQSQAQNISNKIANSTLFISNSGNHSQAVIPLLVSILNWFISLK